MKSIIRSLFAFSTLVLLTAHSSAWAEIAVIANSANPASSISTANSKKLFLGKRSGFKGTPVDQPEGSAVRDTFYQKAAGKNGSQMKAYWSKMIFSGKATPPETVADDAAVKAWVAGHADGIGYVDSGSVDDSVKVLLTLP